MRSFDGHSRDPASKLFVVLAHDSSSSLSEFRAGSLASRLYSFGFLAALGLRQVNAEQCLVFILRQAGGRPHEIRSKITGGSPANVVLDLELRDLLLTIVVVH